MKFQLSDLRIDFDELVRKYNENSRIIIGTALAVLLAAAGTGVAVFFLALRPAEKVMVPDIRGKDLPVALIEMQNRELYPKIQLRYSDNPHDKGTILEQQPSPGSIVKAGRRINLVVSRGVIVDRVENYLGQNIDELKIHLQALFSSSANPLLSVAEPLMYRYSAEAAGTILEQDPPPDTPITAPVKLTLAVSRGPQNDQAKVPDVTGLTIRQVLAAMEESQVLFDFTARAPEGDETAGTVVSQMPAGGSTVTTWTRVPAVVAMPAKSPDGKVYGILAENLPVYPYPFQIRIDAVSPQGERKPLVSLKHPGGPLTVPYALEEGTVLVLNILNKEAASFEVRAEQTEAAE
ncbi:PASTA domain-containing protein [Treponema zuelzerae]|uniref:PASTA domain-containing protein n=1 Tax=Teretinema zuelzerae TaxID=156 RepID=A0AAE3EHC8_9SPIR|nr:PASTA domain-containing protein [Teretinema zuelzerae]MCD1653853.1 PASTA domain-containing protein [Teretinema zuelzerae]